MALYIDDYAVSESEFMKLATKDLKIPKEAVPGDAIKYSLYRDSGTYFLGWNGELIKKS